MALGASEAAFAEASALVESADAASHAAADVDAADAGLGFDNTVAAVAATERATARADVEAAREPELAAEAEAEVASLREYLSECSSRSTASAAVHWHNQCASWLLQP